MVAVVVLDKAIMEQIAELMLQTLQHQNHAEVLAAAAVEAREAQYYTHIQVQQAGEEEAVKLIPAGQLVLDTTMLIKAVLALLTAEIQEFLQLLAGE